MSLGDKSNGLEVAAFWALVASACGAAFSLPLGRALLAVSLVLLVVTLIREGRVPRLPPVAWLAAVFIVVAIVVTIHGANPELGVPKLRKLFWFVGIPVTATLVTSRERGRLLLKAYALGTGVLAVERCFLSVYQAIGLVREGMFNDFTRALIHVGSMTDGQLLMVGILITLGFCLARKQACERRRIGWCLLLVLLVTAQVVNFKRGSWFCTLAFVLLMVGGRAGWRYVLIPAAAAVLLGLLPPVRTRLVDLKKEFRQEGGRLTMWTNVAPALVCRYPWGVGYRSLTNEMMRDVNSRVEPNRDHLHSNLLQVLVATGWMGLVAYVLWMVRAVYDGLVCVFHQREGGRIGHTMAFTWLLLLLALLVNGLVEYNFGDGEIVLIYALAMGRCAACAMNREQSPSAPEEPPSH